jgi:hypothetical protein
MPIVSLCPAILAFLARLYYPPSQRGEGKMAENSNGTLARWATGLLVVSIIISALWVFSVATIKFLWPGQKMSIWPSIIPILLVWGALLSGSIGLRATSSILGAILSMLYAFAGGMMLFTPGPYRVGGLLPILFAVFLYFYSTRTWALHEQFWLKESNRRAGSSNPS